MKVADYLFYTQIQLIRLKLKAWDKMQLIRTWNPGKESTITNVNVAWALQEKLWQTQTAY